MSDERATDPVLHLIRERVSTEQFDPERELSFVCLTSGLLEESRNLDRLQRLSDLVMASVVD